MAKCDEGYICCICDQDVGNLIDSDLYLRFVTGMLDPEVLHTTDEKHIRCNPTLAQYIVSAEFESVTVEGDFDKRKLDAKFVEQRETLVTRGWNRLQELADSDLPILEYPLPEVVAKIQAEAKGMPG